MFAQHRPPRIREEYGWVSITRVNTRPSQNKNFPFNTIRVNRVSPRHPPFHIGTTPGFRDTASSYPLYVFKNTVTGMMLVKEASFRPRIGVPYYIGITRNPFHRTIPYDWLVTYVQSRNSFIQLLKTGGPKPWLSHPNYRPFQLQFRGQRGTANQRNRSQR